MTTYDRAHDANRMKGTPEDHGCHYGTGHCFLDPCTCDCYECCLHSVRSAK
jgi:hypothetical protein